MICFEDRQVRRSGTESKCACVFLPSSCQTLHRITQTDTSIGENQVDSR